jgi:hypothetical protein
MKDPNVTLFLTELRDLMAKREISCIGVELNGDTHGLMTNFVVETGGKDHVIHGSQYLDIEDINNSLK